MKRVAAVVVLAAFSLAFLPPLVCADDDDPVKLGKKTSEWLEMLQKLREEKTDDPKQLEKNADKRKVILENVLALSGPKARGVLPEVFKTLAEDPHERVRAAAAHWLGQTAYRAKQDDINPVSTLEALASALRTDKSVEVREAAAAGIEKVAEVRSDLRVTIPSLTSALKDPAEPVRAAAAKTLSHIGFDAQNALPALVENVRDKKADRFTRSNAAIAIRSIGGANATLANELAEVLADKDAPAGVREEVANTLGTLGKEAAETVPTLAAALTKTEPEVRQAAAKALARLGPEARPALPALKEALKDQDVTVRSQAIRALGALGKDAAEAVPLLRDCLKDTVVEVRLATIQALGSIGPDAKEAVSALAPFTQDAQTTIREAAVDALKKIQGSP
jgi:HEAT repeat protein